MSSVKVGHDVHGDIKKIKGWTKSLPTCVDGVSKMKRLCASKPK